LQENADVSSRKSAELRIIHPEQDKDMVAALKPHIRR
jgi:hypothetical protein